MSAFLRCCALPSLRSWRQGRCAVSALRPAVLRRVDQIACTSHLPAATLLTLLIAVSPNCCRTASLCILQHPAALCSLHLEMLSPRCNATLQRCNAMPATWKPANRLHVHRQLQAASSHGAPQLSGPAEDRDMAHLPPSGWRSQQRGCQATLPARLWHIPSMPHSLVMPACA